ncbi:MAG: hypothetical protein OXH90_09225 [Paracoccaceae bacterium]|nr:hypothetical protein [Paracoccaceae bacterium]MDE2915929.1 hypothetical protein [Paracoccaceae bacterium]
MSNLTEEIKAYEEKRSELERDHFGRWVIVHDMVIVGFYETFQDSATEAVDRFGAGPYLIREIGAGPATLPASVHYNPVVGHG